MMIISNSNKPLAPCRICLEAINPKPDGNKPYYEHILRANSILWKEGGRQPFFTRLINSAGRPGGLIEIDPDQKVVFIGDLHTNIPNLKKIANKYLEELRMRKTTLVVLGDAVHPAIGNLQELSKMESSLKIIDLIILLKTVFPGNFHYIPGNHDSFSYSIAKEESGSNRKALQGLSFRLYLNLKFKQHYPRLLLHFWENCPLAATVGNNLFAAHSAVLRGIFDKTGLVNANLELDDIPDSIKYQLHWNRPDVSYQPFDILSTIYCLGLKKDAYIISGHTPSPDEKNTLYAPFEHYPNHKIILSHRTPTFNRPLKVLEYANGAVREKIV